MPELTQPSQQIYAALRNAAAKFEVPIALLMGVAFVESRFRADAEGTRTAGGWRAKGLMQLGPDVLAQFGVSDPFDAQQNADAAAQFLAERGKAYDWNVDRMLASYVWGSGKLAIAERERKQAPKEVRDYVRQVKSARYYYETRADPVGFTVFDQLGTAIDALKHLNPNWAPANELHQNWQLTAADYSLEGLKKRWEEYGRTFERAPLTDHTTPHYERMEPDNWLHVVRSVQNVKAKVVDLMSPKPAEPEQQTLDFGGGSKSKGPSYALVIIIALYLFSRTR